MTARPLARTGVQVSPLCLGTLMFGKWGTEDHGESIRIIHRALDAGINFIDTADVYADGESEVIVGKALSGSRRDDVILATKAYEPMGPDVNQRGLSKRWLIRAVEDSLRRLGTDWIDLYQMHRAEPTTDIDETLGALTDLVQAGKVRYIGSSTFPASQIVEAQWVARDRGRERFVTEQPPYSMFTRGVEADVLPTCLRHDIAALPWSPLAGGFLSGKWRKGKPLPGSSRSGLTPTRYDMSLPGNQLKFEKADSLGALADEAGVPLPQLAIAFSINHPAVASTVIGPRTLDQLESVLGSVDLVLEDALLDRIDEIVPPGVELTPGASGWQDPALRPAALRRRQE
ncbi:MAG: aldo/keto reductase [Actinobacteria bacterium]|nr:aldo/keto reductase [Actinomycetota bacterium]